MVQNSNNNNKSITTIFPFYYSPIPFIPCYFLRSINNETNLTNDTKTRNFPGRTQ